MVYVLKFNNTIKAKKHKIKEYIRASLIEIFPDATGRFLIPKNLCAYAGIKKEIVMSSSAGIIEIWDKHRYQDIIARGAQGFAELAEEVMGQDDADGIS